MAKCDYCGSQILFGGVRNGTLRFCNQKCNQKGILLSIANQVPPDVVENQVAQVHQGLCPRCNGKGPIEVHTSYRVISALVLTTWRSKPEICCRSCGVKNGVGDMTVSLLLGWWGFPWGIIMTPVFVGRNLHAIFKKTDPSRPSPDLNRLVRLNLAAQLANAGQQVPSAPPAIPTGLP